MLLGVTRIEGSVGEQYAALEVVVLEVEAKEQVIGVGEGHALGEFVIVLVFVIVTELVAHVLAAAVTVLTEVIVLGDGQLAEGDEVAELTRQVSMVSLVETVTVTEFVTVTEMGLGHDDGVVEVVGIVIDEDVEVGVEVDLTELDFVDEVVDEIKYVRQ
jgi:hypothetical protein